MAGTFVFAKKVHKKYANIHIHFHIYFQSASVIYFLGFS